MPPTSSHRKRTAINTLRRFVRQEAPEAEQEDLAHCELCSEPIPASHHRHLLDMESRQVSCACDACALLFSDDRASQFSKRSYKLIPRDTRALPDFRMTDLQWNSLGLPIGMAFFVRRTRDGDDEPGEDIAALYPSPAGGTESLLPLDAWEAIAVENPVLEEMSPDVEALLVNRVGGAEEYYLAPIDTCYELVGLIRLHWRGFSGGKEVWEEIEGFFDRLK